MTANQRKNNTRQQQTMTHIRRSPMVTKKRPNDGNKTTITWQSNVECDRCEKWPKRRSSTNTKRGARRAVKWDDRVKKFYAEHTTIEKNGKTTNPHIGWPAPSPKKNKQDTAKSEIMGHDPPPKKFHSTWQRANEKNTTTSDDDRRRRLTVGKKQTTAKMEQSSYNLNNNQLWKAICIASGPKDGHERPTRADGRDDVVSEFMPKTSRTTTQEK